MKYCFVIYKNTYILKVYSVHFKNKTQMKQINTNDKTQIKHKC